jgi:hypothetical protein
MTVDIYSLRIPGGGKKDLTKTLWGPKARPGQTLTVITGAKSPQVYQEETSEEANFNARLLGSNWCKQPKEKA